MHNVIQSCSIKTPLLQKIPKIFSEDLLRLEASFRAQAPCMLCITPGISRFAEGYEGITGRASNAVRARLCDSHHKHQRCAALFIAR